MWLESSISCPKMRRAVLSAGALLGVGLLVLSLLLTGAVRGQGASNDPRYPEQWALERVGAPCAWQSTTGSEQVTVAVIDTGVDLGHPDLVGRLRSDGYDFASDDADPGDEQGHGTHVSGIIAATLNNAEGIAGLAPGVQILPIRVLGPNGGTDQAIAAGIRYAVERGARVINMSLGAPFLVVNAAPESNRAIREAQDAGVLVVVAAGNEYLPLPNSVSVENLDAMVVAASNESEMKASFSNSGPWVSVTAPGQNILSTMPTYEVEMTSSALPPDQRASPGYDYLSGTSMATPYVSALAALVFSVHPDWSPAQVRSAIERNASRDIYNNHLPHFEILTLLGAGRIDACQTVSE
jgi:subtilisin family serine protease